jgi:inorganic triphosphatase YgiF
MKKKSAPAAQPAEIEMKFALAGASGDQVIDALVAAGLADPARIKDRRQQDSYYDTPEALLAAAGYALRVRHVAGGWIQTIKSAASRDVSAPGLSMRGEWERPLATPAPDRSGFAEAGIDGLLPADAVLTIAFSTDIRRRTILVRPRPLCAVEIAIDEGEIRAGDHSTPVSEVELELVEGSLADLFEVALGLHAATPLLPSSDSKAARGWRLARLDGFTPQSSERTLATGVTKAAKGAPGHRRHGEPTLGGAARTSLRRCLAHLSANMPLALSGDPEGVHQFRVAIRRLRAAFSFFSPVLPEERTQGFLAGIKELAGAAGALRDWDVLSGSTLPGLEAGGLTVRDTLRREAGKKRAAALAAFGKLLSTPRATRLLLELALWVEAGAWKKGLTDKKAALLRQPLSKFARKRLKRQKARLEAFAAAMDWSDLEACHELRKKFKKFRYSHEFYEQYSNEASTSPSRNKQVQEAFGTLNDLAVARHHLSTLKRAGGIPAALAMIDARIDETRQSLPEAWRRFSGKKRTAAPPPAGNDPSPGPG